MTRSIRRQLHILHAYVAASLLVFVVLAVSAFRQPSTPQKFGEVSAERINIVDADGTLRLVISNKDRMHPGVIGGKVIQRSRPVAGLLFFNDHGDEAGGLTVTGREQNGRRTASLLQPGLARMTSRPAAMQMMARLAARRPRYSLPAGKGNDERGRRIRGIRPVLSE